MQFTSIMLLAAGLAPVLVSGAPSGVSRRQDEPSSSFMTFVTFWEKGCDTPPDANGNKSTYQFHDKGEDIPGDPAGECLSITPFGWQSVHIDQADDGK